MWCTQLLLFVYLFQSYSFLYVWSSFDSYAHVHVHVHILLRHRPTTNFVHVWKMWNISLFHEILWTNSLKSSDGKDEIRLSWKLTYILEIYVLLRDTNYVFELFCSQFACRWKILLVFQQWTRQKKQQHKSRRMRNNTLQQCLLMVRWLWKYNVLIKTRTIPTIWSSSRIAARLNSTQIASAFEIRAIVSLSCPSEKKVKKKTQSIFANKRRKTNDRTNKRTNNNNDHHWFYFESSQ